MQPTCSADKAVSQAALLAQLPQQPLYQSQQAPAQQGIGWLLSPQPYCLTPMHVQLIKQLGPALLSFSQAVDQLYRQSLKTPELAWVRVWLEAGKPQHLLQFSQMNRFKRHLPRVIRPDLLVTDTGFTLCEVDAVPGGIGFTTALQQAYNNLGFSLLGAPEGMAQAFLQMLLDAAPPEKPEPFIAIVVSDEAGDYRLEMQWLTGTLAQTYPHIACIHPKQITLMHNQLGYLQEDTGAFTPIDLIYRFFELFDLPNIPQIELIQYAVKKGLVTCTPPFKPHLEEKLTLALLHSPELLRFWEEHLGRESLALLHRVVPETWVITPELLPPYAAIIPPLVFEGATARDFHHLAGLTQKQRQLVIKPSGFSPLAWGSRGVHIGHDIPQAEWQHVVAQAIAESTTTPHLLQRFVTPRVEPYSFFQPGSNDVVEAEGRTRLCPYYFVRQDQAHLAGILATTCPKDKKVIHGMRDGVMRPAMAL